MTLVAQQMDTTIMRMSSTESGEALVKRVAGEVRAEMARQGMSQQALADRLGWQQSRVARRLSDGKHGLIPFDLAELDAISKTLGVPLAQFMPTEASTR